MKTGRLGRSAVNGNSLVPSPAEIDLLGEDAEGRGASWVWGTEEGKARSRESLLLRPNPGLLYTLLKCLIPGEGTCREEGHTSHFRTLCRLT